MHLKKWLGDRDADAIVVLLSDHVDRGHKIKNGSGNNIGFENILIFVQLPNCGFEQLPFLPI